MMKTIKSIKIDQIRFNVPISESRLGDYEVPDVIRAVNRVFRFRVVFGEHLEKPTGKDGYTRSIQWGLNEQGGLVSLLFNPRRVDMGVMIDFTSTGKMVYDALCRLYGLPANWRKIISCVYQEFKGHTSRIDVAIDLVNKGYSVNSIYEKLKSGKFVFINPINQKINLTHIQHIGRSNEVNTIYVGSRVSDAFLRIYNKKLEQTKRKGIFHALANRCHDWVRIEGEFKNRECHDMGAMVSTLATDNIASYLGSYILKHWKLVFNDQEKS